MNPTFGNETDLDGENATPPVEQDEEDEVDAEIRRKQDEVHVRTHCAQPLPALRIHIAANRPCKARPVPHTTHLTCTAD